MKAWYRIVLDGSGAASLNLRKVVGTSSLASVFSKIASAGRFSLQSFRDHFSLETFGFVRPFMPSAMTAGKEVIKEGGLISKHEHELTHTHSPSRTHTQTLSSSFQP